ncbi:hypothetical protein LDENG_00072320 [Lucifuga dentata]|nr:hypothetical protein LDENG_00072320 [Lucifuga dentata]
MLNIRDKPVNGLACCASTLGERKCICTDAFCGYCSVFNIIPSKLSTKLQAFGLCNSIRNWISDFLTGRPQCVKIDNAASSSRTVNTGSPQGCALSPLLLSLYTYDCKANHSSNHVIKSADDTIVIGLNDNDERAYTWSLENNLVLNVNKTKELIIDFRTAITSMHPLKLTVSLWRL